MVSKKDRYYICDSCGFTYKKRETAQKCEDWCNKHKSCNIEITNHAIKEEDK